VQNADVGIDQSYNQLTDSTYQLDEAYFSARAFYAGSGDYTAPGTLTIPGGATYSLIDQGYSTPELGYQQTFVGPTGLTDAQAAFPTGTYSLTYLPEINQRRPSASTIPAMPFPMCRWSRTFPLSRTLILLTQ
jgi:hypothetical protein